MHRELRISRKGAKVWRKGAKYIILLPAESLPFKYKVKIMIHPIKSPGEVPQNLAAEKQNEEREKNEVHPQDDDMADVTPRNIDPSDDNSAEPDIEDDTVSDNH